MTKTIIHALIACALGVALGLLWDSEARAANEVVPSCQVRWEMLRDVKKVALEEMRRAGQLSRPATALDKGIVAAEEDYVRVCMP